MLVVPVVQYNFIFCLFWKLGNLQQKTKLIILTLSGKNGFKIFTKVIKIITILKKFQVQKVLSIEQKGLLYVNEEKYKSVGNCFTVMHLNSSLVSLPQLASTLQLSHELLWSDVFTVKVKIQLNSSPQLRVEVNRVQPSKLGLNLL